jgi:hypothetical protein
MESKTRKKKEWDRYLHILWTQQSLKSKLYSPRSKLRMAESQQPLHKQHDWINALTKEKLK